MFGELGTLDERTPVGTGVCIPVSIIKDFSRTLPHALHDNGITKSHPGEGKTLCSHIPEFPMQEPSPANCTQYFRLHAIT